MSITAYFKTQLYFKGNFSNSTQQTYCAESGGISVAMILVEN